MGPQPSEQDQRTWYITMIEDLYLQIELILYCIPNFYAYHQ